MAKDTQKTIIRKDNYIHKFWQVLHEILENASIGCFNAQQVIISCLHHFLVRAFQPCPMLKFTYTYKHIIYTQKRLLRDLTDQVVFTA